jgi:hypothetical protein
MQRTIARVRSEFLEMPGLRLTVAQASRLCGVERAVCQTVLDALVETKFLREANGVYARLTDGAVRSASSVSAERDQTRVQGAR